jgi:hypothetical protein
MQKRILAWVSVLVGGVIVLAFVSLFVVARSAVRQREGPRPGAAVDPPLPADTALIAGLPGTNPTTLEPGSSPPTADATVSSTDIDRIQIVPNVGPLDSTLLTLPIGPRQRVALDVVLRKGIVYQVKERTPNVVRYVVGAAFFSEPAKYRNPLVRNLYHANLSGRTPGQPPLYFEFWDLRRKFAEYVADTFYIGTRYAKPR